ncbi:MULTISPECIES: hypothetical protein [Arthrospira]|nr:hypothetical protein [Arthrospira platensis]MBD2671582.1 hypothetical protein [Arthrospira platensis FACHB-439]MBD2712766.1 hypothetical protein [Arthrospira platensis FACHB-835]MDF2208481.1 hypothetical protein [Arthrospira platensis NCB002]MDT9312845.1 hypothetical protein [Limnospira sp. Paracas R14]QQW28978.1 hypothetical protein AP9108_29985 [Arthrospira sp. PCC 9108]
MQFSTRVSSHSLLPTHQGKMTRQAIAFFPNLSRLGGGHETQRHHLLV